MNNMEAFLKIAGIAVLLGIAFIGLEISNRKEK